MGNFQLHGVYYWVPCIMFHFLPYKEGDVTEEENSTRYYYEWGSEFYQREGLKKESELCKWLGKVRNAMEYWRWHYVRVMYSRVFFCSYWWWSYCCCCYWSCSCYGECMLSFAYYSLVCFCWVCGCCLWLLLLSL